MIETESSLALFSRLVRLIGRIMALNCVLVVSLFLNIVVIIPVIVSILFDYQGKLVVDCTFDDLSLAVFHSNHIFIEVAFEIVVQILDFALTAKVKAAWH